MKKKLLAVFALLFVGLSIVGVTHHQMVKDYVIAQTKPLDSASSELGERLLLTSSAQRLYKASQPKIEPADAFNNSCKSVAHEHSIVLGCYTRQTIYIYDVTDPRLNGVKEVTAAHELLHAVYERMSGTEKSQLSKALTETAESIDDQRFKDTLDEYRRTEPGQLENELHSILGTEIAVLPASLEAHYRKYFTNRATIIGYAKKYEDAFGSLDAKIKGFDQQLADLKSRKETLEALLSQQQTSIESEKARLDQLKSTGEAESYNAAVPGYNELIQNYNSDIQSLREIVEEYNQMVEERNSIAATQNDLYKKLDSSYSPL
jgi:hypothetical protein